LSASSGFDEAGELEHVVVSERDTGDEHAFDHRVKPAAA
jgi:hypothetical protein